MYIYINSTLFHMQITQPPTSNCIMTFQNSFIDLKSSQNKQRNSND